MFTQLQHLAAPAQVEKTRKDTRGKHALWNLDLFDDNIEGDDTSTPSLTHSMLQAHTAQKTLGEALSLFRGASWLHRFFFCTSGGYGWVGVALRL